MIETSDLPKQAQTYIQGIQSDIDRTKSLADNSTANESTWTLQQTLQTYIPDAVKAYLALPVSSRHIDKIGPDGETADDILIHQLKKMAWATRKAVTILIAEKGKDLLANNRFINDKFVDEQHDDPYVIIGEPQKTHLIKYNLSPTPKVIKQDELLEDNEEDNEKNNEEYIDISDGSNPTKPFKTFISIVLLAIVSLFGYFISYGYSSDKNIIEDELNTLKIISSSIKNSSSNYTGNPNDMGNGLDNNKPGQYVLKVINGKKVIYDRQEHWGKNLDRLPRPDSEHMCDNSCWHLGWEGNHVIGMP